MPPLRNTWKTLFANLKEHGWFCFPKVVFACAALGVLLALPSLWLGLAIDDYIHVGIIEGTKIFGSRFDLFRFAPGDAAAMKPWLDTGPYPWWTLPEMRIIFFRPLSSALETLDHAVFGLHIWPWHLHSILWYVALIYACGLLFRRILPEPVAALALLLFALDEAHWCPVAWIANRNALVAVVPTLLGLCAHITWREDGWKPGLPLSLLGFAIGLAGGESAIGIIAYLGSYELFSRKYHILQSVKRLLPAAAIGVMYVCIYKHFNCGTYGSGAYIDPIGEPFIYLLNAPGRMCALLGNILLGVPADIWGLNVHYHPILIAGGIIGLLIFAVLLRRVWPRLEIAERRTLYWLIPGSILSLMPVAATFPTSRLLLAPSLAGSVLLASILHAWWQWRGEVTPPVHWIRAAGWFLVVLNMIIPLAAWPGQTLVVRRLLDKSNRIYCEAQIADGDQPGERNVLMVAPDPLTGVYVPIVRAFMKHRYTFAPWLVLSNAPYSHRMTRTASNCLEVDVLDGCMLESEFERLFRGPNHPFHAGEQVKLKDVTISILAMGPTGPTKVTFEFDRDLDSPTLHFLEWKDGHLAPTPPPRVGQSIDIPFQHGVI